LGESKAKIKIVFNLLSADGSFAAKLYRLVYGSSQKNCRCIDCDAKFGTHGWLGRGTRRSHADFADLNKRAEVMYADCVQLYENVYRFNGEQFSADEEKNQIIFKIFRHAFEKEGPIRKGGNLTSIQRGKVRKKCQEIADLNGVSVDEVFGHYESTFLTFSETGIWEDPQVQENLKEWFPVAIGAQWKKKDKLAQGALDALHHACIQLVGKYVKSVPFFHPHYAPTFVPPILHIFLHIGKQVMDIVGANVRVRVDGKFEHGEEAKMEFDRRLVQSPVARSFGKFWAVGRTVMLLFQILPSILQEGEEGQILPYGVCRLVNLMNMTIYALNTDTLSPLFIFTYRAKFVLLQTFLEAYEPNGSRNGYVHQLVDHVADKWEELGLSSKCLTEQRLEGGHGGLKQYKERRDHTADAVAKYLSEKRVRAETNIEYNIHPPEKKHLRPPHKAEVVQPCVYMKSQAARHNWKYIYRILKKSQHANLVSVDKYGSIVLNYGDDQSQTARKDATLYCLCDKSLVGPEIDCDYDKERKKVDQYHFPSSGLVNESTAADPFNSRSVLRLVEERVSAANERREALQQRDEEARADTILWKAQDALAREEAVRKMTEELLEKSGDLARSVKESKERADHGGMNSILDLVGILEDLRVVVEKGKKLEDSMERDTILEAEGQVQIVRDLLKKAQDFMDGAHSGPSHPSVEVVGAVGGGASAELGRGEVPTKVGQGMAVGQKRQLPKEVRGLEAAGSKRARALLASAQNANPRP